MSDRKELAAYLAEYLGLADWAYAALVVLIATASYLPVRLWLLPFLRRVMEGTRAEWDDILVRTGGPARSIWGRTFNVLLAEVRRVAASLIAVD